MAGPWQVLIYERQQLLHSTMFTSGLALGRQRNNAEDLFSHQQDRPADPLRIVIARLDEINVSRAHALIEPIDDDHVQLLNESTSQTIGLPDGGQLQPRETCQLLLPAMLTLGKKIVRVQGPDGDDGSIQGLASAATPPGTMGDISIALAGLGLKGSSVQETESLFKWIQSAMGVLQSATGSLEFFAKAAQTLVDMVAMDTGLVLLRDKESWVVQAQATSKNYRPNTNFQPSRQVLNKVVREKRTFWQVPPQGQAMASLIRVQDLVAAPILNRNAEVIGVLYGDRGKESGIAKPISKLEAMLVDLLASGVAAGLARVEQEEAAVRARVQYEEFFTAEMAHQMAVQPELLRGREAEVSVLFCDIRGFSRITERLGPARTLDWIRDVLTAISDCVLAQQGVVVDFIGDELMAMWGAPSEQPDHADRACRAALAMLDMLPRLNQRWQPIVEEVMDLGIGINTGTARVGNVGTERKFKYGPLGNTVNLASRVQGASKYLKTRLLATGGTFARLDPRFEPRRLCQVKVVNIREAVTLYELSPQGSPNWAVRKERYESALQEFENGNFRAATGILGNLVIEYRDDGPSLVLLSRAVDALVHESEPFDPVWQLPGK